MTDRLRELQKNKGAADLSDVEVGGVGDEYEGLNAAGGGQNELLREFFSDVELVKKNVNVIKQVIKRVSEIQQQVVFANSNDKEAELSAELKPLTDETNKRANQTKQILQDLREGTEKMKQRADTKQSEIRIRENLVATLTRKFIDVMKEYQSVQTKYKTEIKKKVKRHVQIVKSDASSEEIDAIIRNGGADKIIKETILQGEASETVRNMYLLVSDKYQDVLALEQSINELNQMFIDFALLTEQQGELLDQIEFQVKAASDYIDEGNAEMVKAIEIQKSIRRNQCIMLIIVLVIIGIIVVVIIVTTGGGGSDDSSDSTRRLTVLGEGSSDDASGALLDAFSTVVKYAKSASLRGNHIVV